jgi:hypothetical protein
MINEKHNISIYFSTYLAIYLLEVVGFELRALPLLGRHTAGFASRPVI